MDEAATRVALRPFGIISADLKMVTKQPDRAVWQVTTLHDKYAIKCTALCKRAPKIGAVSHYLHRQGVPTIKAIPTTAGELFVTVDKCCFLLFPWVEGVRPLYEDRGLTRPMATLLAQFHEASRGYVATGGPIEDRLTKRCHDLRHHLDELRKAANRRNDAFSRVFRPYVSWLHTRASWVSNQLDRSTAYESLVAAASRSPLLTHGDYSAVNLLADEKGNLTIIDLDDVAISLPVWEISRFISWMNHDSLGWSDERFETVLDAYRQVRPISAAEEELLRIDQVYPRQALSLAREYYLGSPDRDLVDRFERCIANDLDMLRYLGVAL